MLLAIDAEFRSLIPPLTPGEYTQLEQNVVAEGCRDALVVWDGILLDGHNRYEICTKRDIQFRTIPINFDNRDAAKEWVIRNQFGRRNLSAYDRSVLVLRLKELFAEKAKETQGIRTDLTSSRCQEKVHTDKALAKVAGVGHDTIHKVSVIEQKAPEEVKWKVKQGAISINQAYQAVRREEKLKTVEEKISTAKGQTIGFVDIYNPVKKYSIIYADPPWKYWSGGNKNQSLHYPGMTIEELCSLPIKDISDDSCILFLWATYPILPESFKVIEAWGFKYSTCGFVWIKKNKVDDDSNFFGCGNWTRANSELCLIATKGQVLRLDAGISQVIETIIEEHSKKPAIARDLIVRLVGELPRIELFSRQSADGWDVWGNEL